jgi:pimeloyl-ACP methyl ester carboxylesterase
MQIDFKNKVYVGSNNRKSVFDCRIPLEPKAVIVFVHGYKGYKDWGAWNLMEDFFLKANYGFVKLNLSHNGGSIDQPIDFPDLQAFGENRYSYEVNDLNTIIEETDRIIRQECMLDIPIYLIGHSRGGGVAILTAVNNATVRKVVSLAGISNIASRFPIGDDLLEWERSGVLYVMNGRTKQDMPHFYSFYQDYRKNEDTLNIESAAENLSVPFLQVHGDMDLAVSISEGQSVARWTDTRLAVIKGAGHTFGVAQPWEGQNMPPDMKVVVEKMLDFFEENEVLEK